MGGTIDISFPVLAPAPIPADHGYHLYAAISRVLPDLHKSNGLGVHPIGGLHIGNRLLQLCRWSRLVLRASCDSISGLIRISGSQLTIWNTNLRIGVPQVLALRPAASLRSRLVTIKGFLDDAPFIDAVRRQLDSLGVSSNAFTTIGKRRTLRIKDKEIVGYELFLLGLSEGESIRVQEQGIGGRRHMGCGLFLPSERKGTEG